MPNDVKAIVSVVTLIVAIAFAYWENASGKAGPVLVRDRLCRFRRRRHVGVPRGARRQADAGDTKKPK